MTSTEVRRTPARPFTHRLRCPECRWTVRWASDMRQHFARKWDGKCPHGCGTKLQVA